MHQNIEVKANPIFLVYEYNPDYISEEDFKNYYEIVTYINGKNKETLYKNYNIKKVYALRQVNANVEGSGKVSEVLVRNY